MSTFLPVHQQGLRPTVSIAPRSNRDSIMAQLLMQDANTGPRPTGPLGAASRIGQSLMGAYLMDRQDRRDQERQSAIGAALEGADLSDPSTLARLYGETGESSFLNAAVNAANRRPPERRIIKGADGYSYYADTAERVLPDVEADETADAASYGLTPNWGLDEEGNYVPLQFSDQGRAVASELPEGITPVPPGDIAEQKARGKALGTAGGEAEASLPDDLAMAEQMLSTIQGIKTDPNRELATGGSRYTTGLFEQLPGGAIVDFDSKVKQLSGQTFLQAYQQLKGGGHITEVEGLKAEQAIARLNVQQSDPAFLQSLNDLEDVVQAGIGRLREKAGIQEPTRPQAATPEPLPAAPPDVLQGARKAIADGKDPAAVRQRLIDSGYSPEGI